MHPISLKTFLKKLADELVKRWDSETVNATIRQIEVCVGYEIVVFFVNRSASSQDVIDVVINKTANTQSEEVYRDVEKKLEIIYSKITAENNSVRNSYG